MSRKEAREIAFKILYQLEVLNDFENPDIEKYIKDVKLGDQEEYVKTLIANIRVNKEKIDTMINDNSKGWPLPRIAKIDLTLLRVAIAESLYIDDVPTKVAINEAIELAKRYSDERSPKFINAVLGKIEF